LSDGALTVTAEGFLLRVRLTPGAAFDRVDGPGDGYLAARVRAKPENGKANAALEALLAKALGAPKRAVSVTRGGKSRLKTVAVTAGAETLARARTLLDNTTGGNP